MIPQRIEQQPAPRPAADPASATDPWRPRPTPGIDWPHWTRLLERRRRALVVPAVWPGWVYREMTRASFRLDGIVVSPADVTDALTPSRARRLSQPLRSRPARRLRAHLAILRSIDRFRRQNAPLSPGQVVRWYTVISSGLSTVALAPADGERLAAVVRRVNSPSVVSSRPSPKPPSCTPTCWPTRCSRRSTAFSPGCCCTPTWPPAGCRRWSSTPTPARCRTHARRHHRHAADAIEPVAGPARRGVNDVRVAAATPPLRVTLFRKPRV